MARTTVDGQQVRDGSIQRVDLDVTTVGQAVITKIIAGTGIVLSQTGADAGTGDVTVSAGTPNAARATAGGAQNVATGTPVKIQFPTKTYDLANNWSTTLYRFTAPVAGIYYLETYLRFNGNTTGTLYLYKSNVQYSELDYAAANTTKMGGADSIQLAANDYIEVFANLGTKRTVLDSSYVTARRLT